MKKAKITILGAMLFAAFSLMPMFAFAQELSGCCCSPTEGDAYEDTLLSYTECPPVYRFVLPTQDDFAKYGFESPCDEVCAEWSGGYVPPGEEPPEGVGCGDEQYDAAPVNLRATNVMGQRDLVLFWDTLCPATHFTIGRCKGTLAECGNDPASYPTLSYGQLIPTPVFTDNQDLLWSQDYSYMIKANYIQSGVSQPAFVSISTGDIECWNRVDDSKFCLSYNFYERDYIMEYLKLKGYVLNTPAEYSSKFQETVEDEFGVNFNKAYYCWPNNELSTANNVCVGVPEGFCSINEQGTPQCVEPCDPTSLNNYFGFYYDEYDCKGYPGAKKYCYVDKSNTIVDKCYFCSPEMACNDYLTKKACEDDNCAAGSCSWKDVYPDIGIGVCVDSTYSNCESCTDKPVTNAVDAYSEIFGQCSFQKCNALGDADEPCFWREDDWECDGCNGVTCMDYPDITKCASPLGVILHANNSVVQGSNDQCKIKVCSWIGTAFAGDCKKDGDGNGLPDCQGLNGPALVACEKDYIAPISNMIATGTQGIYSTLNINIFDKTSRSDPGEYKTGSKAAGYTTYFCTYLPGGNCNIHSNPFTTSSITLSLHNTEIIDHNTGETITTLSAGDNYINYYTTDPAKNPSFVKTLKVYACIRCVGPQITNYSLENGFEILGNLYTNQVRPILNAKFDVNSAITTAEIDAPDGFFVSSMSYGSLDGKDYTFVAESTLPEGSYVFRINAQDDEGTLMNQEFILPFIVDLSAGGVLFTANGKPADGAQINDTKANIGIAFSEPVSSIVIQMNGRNITSSFTTSNNQQFTANNLPLDEGETVIGVSARDFAGNLILQNATISVNGRPPVIRLKSPTYGVSSSEVFDIVVQTLNDVTCRYLYDVPVPPAFNFADLKRFDSTGTTLHSINSFAEIPRGDTRKRDLHVFCIDPLWGMANKTFQISLDVVPPKIISASASPEIIMEEINESTFRTLFKVTTDELTFCKYSSQTTNYAAMEGRFPDFRQEPAVPWPNTVDIAKKLHDEYIFEHEDNESYSYNIRCEDLGGLTSEPASITFSVDLSRQYEVTSHTPLYWNTSLITLAVESNKRSYCFHGTSESAITSPFQQDGEYSHKTNIANVGLGRHTFYVRCNTRYLSQEISPIIPIMIIVDTTAPQMVNVSDDGPIPSDPEFSYLTDRLRANWLGKDNESNVTRYYYKIETFYGKVPVINWTPSTLYSEWTWIANLNLVEDTTYRVLVKAENAAGLLGSELDSNGVTISLAKLPPICNNSQQDANETGLDCGGICPPCGDGQVCISNSDCQSSYCKEGICAAASCDDIIRNGAESDVDCGGSCKPCAIGSLCLTGNDCESKNCRNGMCSEPDPCFNGILDGTETDVDCGGSCAIGCASGKSCTESQDCISGLCIGNACLEPKGVGEACENDIECSTGLVCKSSICKEPRKELGEFCAADYECEAGLLCYNSLCSADTDGDGMPDDWELTYGLDPNNPADAMQDKDEDGLSNLDEYKKATNPENEDTDGDAWYDGEELSFSTNPLDPESKPSAWQGLIHHPLDYWWLWLLLLILLAGLIVGIIFGYKKAVKIIDERKKKAAAKPAAKAAEKKAAEPEKKKELTEKEKEELKKKAEEERKIAEKLEKVRELVKKKMEAPKLEKKDWLDLDKVMLPLRKERPEEIKPAFAELDSLKKGKLGMRGRKKALSELEKLLGKKAEAEREAAKETEAIAKKKKVSSFERLAALGAGRGRKFKGKKDPLLKLKMMALAALPPEERKKFLEKLMLLRTGKLTADEKRELFEKLKIIADYYRMHRMELDKELLEFEHPGSTLEKAEKPAKEAKKKQAKKQGKKKQGKSKKRK